MFTYFCSFNDIRDVETAFSDVDMVNANWTTTYITQTEFASAVTVDGGSPHEKTSFHDGQVIFAVSFEGPTSEFNANAACDAVRKVAEAAGEVRAFAEIPAQYPRLEFRVEYYKISNAKEVLKTALKSNPNVVGVRTHPHPLKNMKSLTCAQKWSIVARELPDYTIGASGANGMTALNEGVAGVDITSTPHRHSNTGVEHFTSPTGRTAWRVDENGNEIPSQPPRMLPKVGPTPFGQPMLDTPDSSRGRFWSAPSPHTPSHHLMQGTYTQPRSGSWNGVCYSHDTSPNRSPIPSPQAVEIWKIENGQDVRTTVMLRNIPNRMNCWQLKEILDHTSHGCYDFSYLRIDFEKGTNVGYAFVNFSDPMHIPPFVQHYQGKRWQMANPRLVELSYATVQGYDCLVEKFRNSAIMSEYRDYRPKLWYTKETAPEPSMIGTEAPFPAPNNLSKKQRSHDNAGQIGLYAPRSGYMSRERGRRSQYDRGTPAQMHEEAMYQMSPLNYAPAYGYAMQPRLGMGPPPSFGNMPYGTPVNQYAAGAYMGNPMIPVAPAYGNGMWEGTDPFGPGGAYNGHYAAPQHSGYSNGHNNGYGMAPGTPASRLRTHTNGRLGGKPRYVSVAGGPVQSPMNSYGGGCNYNAMPKVMEDDEHAAHMAATTEGGYNDTAGPFSYPSGY